jgi:hypothetical protein
VQISYGYLAVLLVFSLLIGVVIGDQLGAANGGGSDPGRSGSCSGLASARLHECVHRLGQLRAGSRRGNHGGYDAACETLGVNGSDDD